MRVIGSGGFRPLSSSSPSPWPTLPAVPRYPESDRHDRFRSFRMPFRRNQVEAVPCSLRVSFVPIVIFLAAVLILFAFLFFVWFFPKKDMG
jgi:hypothetical protein